MKKRMELLDVVDENNNIIGQATRHDIHEKGLLHREVHVWIVNDQNQLLLQRRSMNVDTYPGLWDLSVGGHVELGFSYGEAVLQELQEETGIKAELKDLLFLGVVHKTSHDKLTGRINNVLDANYLYKYLGRPQDLKLEEGKIEEFRFWSLQEMKEQLPEEQPVIQRLILGASREILNKVLTNAE